MTSMYVIRGRSIDGTVFLSNLGGVGVRADWSDSLGDALAFDDAEFVVVVLEHVKRQQVNRDPDAVIGQLRIEEVTSESIAVSQDLNQGRLSHEDHWEQVSPWFKPLFTFESTGDAYDGCQCDDALSDDGTLLFVPSERVIGLSDTWPVAVTVAYGNLHSAATPDAVTHFPRESVMRAIDLAAKLGWEVDPIFARASTYDWSPKKETV